MQKIELNYEKRLSYPVGEDMFAVITYINQVISKIKENNLLENIQTVTLWVRGSSGAILATLFSSKLIEMNIVVRIVHVRKDGESNHGNSYRIIEAESINNSYNIIIDDFISEGVTVCAIYDIFNKYNPTSCIHMLIVQTINSDDCLNFQPKCLITNTYGLGRIPEKK